ncbi:MAG: hypothetical protein HFG70_12945 [Hungatella sp.]|nr:hypothetical protein [Hungatella sp.]
MEQLLNSYYENDARKLHTTINNIFNRSYGGIKDKDMEEFYGIGTDVLFKIWHNNTYDPSKGDFDGYVYRALCLAIIDEFKKRTCGKRTTKNFILDKKTGKPFKINIQDVSLDAPVKEGENLTQGDLIPSDFDMEAIIFERCEDEKVERFLNSLPKITRQIIEMKMDNIPVSEIKEKLEINDREYSNYMNYAKMNENLTLFTKVSNMSNRCIKEESKMNNIIPIDVTDNYRMDKIPLGSLLDDMRDGKINKKHILQRKPFQWTERQKNKYLTRVLNAQPIPEIIICEQTINGKRKSHLIDGLQRLSYAELFRADGIVVKSDGAEFCEIPYKEYIFDSEGNVLTDNDGDAIFEEKIFNVIGKRFSELPQFLKERFNKFNINVTTYFNCSDDQIAYHIRNYNNQEGMNKAQYEFTGVNVHIAERIKYISDKHPFFKDDYGKYTAKNKIKGDIEKVVVESIMVINFLGEWKKDVKDSFTFVNQNVTDQMFDNFLETLDRLCKVVNKEDKNMFTTTNSPIWFAVFEKFKTLNIPDSRFTDFIKYIRNALDADGLHLEGEPFADIYKSRNTRDKTIVVKKVSGLIALMYEFLHITETDAVNSTVKFISENLNMDMESIQCDLEFYENTLEKLQQDTIRDGSKLLNRENHLSLLTMIVYSYKEDKDLDDWMKQYAEKNNTYYTDQKKNFLHMRDDFERYYHNER